jgi:putative transposase
VGNVVHVIVVTRDREPAFSPSPLASEVFALVADEPGTLAACLMPDHLHWLYEVEDNLSRKVAQLKSLSTRISWRHGRSGSLWQRSFHDRAVRGGREVILETARYIVENPVRAGRVERSEEYPYQVVTLRG